MNSIIMFSFVCLLIVLGVILIAYLPRLIAWFGAFQNYPHLHSDKQNKIAVLIPARNESAVIGPLLASLSRQTYKNFEVFVIVKDKNDPTIAMAHKYGFHVHAEVTQTSKSDALDSVIQLIFRRDRDLFDAYLIIDADSGINDDYLEEMNNAMASGSQVIVSKKLVKNYYMAEKKAATLQGCANGYIWVLFDDMGNKWKSKHKIANFTVGSGLLIRKDIILHNNGWCYKSTITEDCELAGDIIANGWTTYYAPYAPIYMEEAPTLRMTNKRRTRWMTGLTDSQRLYKWKDKSMGNIWDVYFSRSVFLTYFYFGLLVFYLFGALMTSFVLFLIGDPSFWTALLVAAYSASIIYLTFFVMAAFALVVSWKDMPGHLGLKIATLFYTPIHYIGYIKIMALVFSGLSSRKWDQIARVGATEAR